MLQAFPLLSLLLARHLMDRPQFLKRCAAAAASIYLLIALFVAPIAARFIPAAQLFRQSEKELRPETEFGGVDFQEPGLVWYFRSQVKGWMTPLNSTSAAQFMEKDGSRFVILPTPLVTKVFPNPPANWKTFSATGFNIAKGKRIDLTLVLKPD